MASKIDRRKAVGTSGRNKPEEKSTRMGNEDDIQVDEGKRQPTQNWVNEPLEPHARVVVRMALGPLTCIVGRRDLPAGSSGRTTALLPKLSNPLVA